jgi:hypothetical protein
MSAWWLVPWALLWFAAGVLLGKRVGRWARQDREMFDLTPMMGRLPKPRGDSTPRALSRQDVERARELIKNGDTLGAQWLIYRAIWGTKDRP